MQPQRLLSCFVVIYQITSQDEIACFSEFGLESGEAKMSDPLISRGEVVGLILKLATLTTVSYYTMRLLIDALDPTRKQRLAAAKQAELMLTRLGIQPEVKLNEHEMMIASQLVDPASVQVKFEDIAGHGELIKEIRQTVILPIQVCRCSPELKGY